jgi:hypothetical protein
LGQVGEDEVKGPTSKDCWHVLQEDVSRFHLANHAPEVGPQPTVICRAAPLPCDREGLAGEPRRDNIHDSTPRAAVKGGKVIPDRSRIQGFVFHARSKDGRGVGFPLNVTHGPVSRHGKAESEFEAANPGTKGKTVDGM